MLVFATSDKGGTGRSVTSSNVVYRRALQGSDVCYLDFDFGSPTVGAIFNVTRAISGTSSGAGYGGLHSYLRGKINEPEQLDVWSETESVGLRGRPLGAGRLVLLPGDAGGGEFQANRDVVQRCVHLFLRLQEEFDLCLVDLSAGRSSAIDMVLAATAEPELRSVTTRWLVFHRWTRQHIIAAASLVHAPRGILDGGVDRGHDRDTLRNSIRFVRTAVVNPDSPELAQLRPAQVAWLREANRDLQELAGKEKLGRTTTLGSVPLDPVLQWREQLITDNDTNATQIANRETVVEFEKLAELLVRDSEWEGL